MSHLWWIFLLELVKKVQMHPPGPGICNGGGGGGSLRGGGGKRRGATVALVDFGLVSDTRVFMMLVSVSFLIGSKGHSNILQLKYMIISGGSRI